MRIVLMGLLTGVTMGLYVGIIVQSVLLILSVWRNNMAAPHLAALLIGAALLSISLFCQIGMTTGW